MDFFVCDTCSTIRGRPRIIQNRFGESHARHDSIPSRRQRFSRAERLERLRMTGTQTTVLAYALPQPNRIARFLVNARRVFAAILAFFALRVLRA